MIAGPLRRLAAFILDGLLASVLSFILGILGLMPDILTDEYSDPAAASQNLGMYYLIILVIYLVIQCIFYTRSTSLGKAILRMQVVTKDSQQPAGFGKMLLRETVGKALSGIVFGLGYLWILFNKDRQAWHDKIVNTVVIIKQ